MDCKKAQSLVTAYIMRKLNDKDLEDFLEHVDSCEECYEELEIYYTVHYTIARLDEDEADQVYNVKKALQNRLEESRFYIWRTKVSRIYRIGLMVLAELLLVVILMTQADLWRTEPWNTIRSVSFYPYTEKTEGRQRQSLSRVKQKAKQRIL